MTKICCIFNYAPHYRSAVYKMMEDELDCHFFFGNNVKANIRKIDYQIFKHDAEELKSIWFFNRMYWIVGSIGLLFKPYNKYLLTGEIHCLSNWMILVLGRIFGKKVFLWSHGWYGKETLTQSFIKKIFFSMAEGTFLYGEHARQLMIKNGINEKKLHVIYNSLDYEKTQLVRKQLTRNTIYGEKFSNKYPVLIFIGRLATVKKLDLLIHALYKMVENGKQLNLVIVGDGNEKERLELIVKQFGLTQNVWFFGPSYDEQKTGELIYNADLCVSPGNVGLTAIHSLSYGTPVITHNNFAKQMPEFEAIEDGVTGAFFKDENIGSLQNIIENWLLKYPQKDEQLIKACYRGIDDFYNPTYQLEVLKNVLGA